MAFAIRSASLTDLPSIATLDIAAHKPNSALLNMNLFPPDDIHTLYVSRYAHLLSQSDHYRFLVAITSKSETTDGGEIAGFLVGARPKPENSEENEWNPVFPEDAPVDKLAWFSGLMKMMKEDKMKYYKNDMWGSLSNSHKTFSFPNYIALTLNRTRSPRNITHLPETRSRLSSSSPLATRSRQCSWNTIRSLLTIWAWIVREIRLCEKGGALGRRKRSRMDEAYYQYQHDKSSQGNVMF